ncbi:MAG: phosphonoacetaldehyde hydrolase [Alphaproteobacteria bacterium]|nr:phosphonoacetaldehyde hydrolase [Alphaproteobacteria bacterium]
MMIGYRQSYLGPLRGIIFDWAGTLVDFGCFAPAAVFVEVFRRHGVEITMAEARGPMGTHKRDHIAAIGQMPTVADAWRRRHNHPFGPGDVDRLFAEFAPRQVAVLDRYATLIPGVAEVLASLRVRGLRIGTCSGYTRAMVDVVEAAAKRQGFTPDCSVAADEVRHGRPLPGMCLKVALELGLAPLLACVKVDDTPPGIAEGLNAGMWTVGLSLSGNEAALTLAELAALDPEARAATRARAETRLAGAGAHYVIDSVADLLPCLDLIEARLARGETP